MHPILNHMRIPTGNALNYFESRRGLIMLVVFCFIIVFCCFLFSFSTHPFTANWAVGQLYLTNKKPNPAIQCTEAFLHFLVELCLWQQVCTYKVFFVGFFSIVSIGVTLSKNVKNVDPLYYDATHVEKEKRKKIWDRTEKLTNIKNSPIAESAEPETKGNHVYYELITRQSYSQTIRQRRTRKKRKLAN